MLDEVEFVKGVVPIKGHRVQSGKNFSAPTWSLSRSSSASLMAASDFWIADFATFGVDLVASFELGDFLRRFFMTTVVSDGINIHGDVENLVDVDKGGNPTSVERVRG